MNRIIAIGDVHGCYHTLVALLDKIGYDDTRDMLIFIGDLIDRGRFSYETVSLVRSLQTHAFCEEGVICIRGNHEQMAIDAFQYDYDRESDYMNTSGDAALLWYFNGGESTMDSYSEYRENLLRDVRWFKSFPLYYETPDFIFCHAGLSRPGIRNNNEHDLIWGRRWIDEDTRKREKQVIFGHTPNTDVPYETKTGDICIDAGCVFGGSLCAMIIPENGEKKFVCVQKSNADK